MPRFKTRSKPEIPKASSAEWGGEKSPLFSFYKDENNNCYALYMSKISSGTAHELPADLQKVLKGSSKALAAWEDITPLARNEWICWTVSVKTLEKRKEHVERVVSELTEGMRRPCCWVGCTHRKDKPMSRSQKFVLSRGAKKK